MTLYVGTTVDLGGIVGAVAARARAMTPEFDPGGFLKGLSGQLQGLIPHDRVTVLYLDEGGRTFSVFAEHAAGDAPRHDGRYTVALARASRYPSAEAVSSCAYPLAHLEVRRVRPGRTERCPLDGGERRPRRPPSGAARLDGAAPHGRRARHPRPSRCLVLVCGR